DLLVAAFRDGAATEADATAHLLAPGEEFNDLGRLTAPKEPAALRDAPRLRAVVDRCRQRVIEVELTRGENPTAATLPARARGSVSGLATLLRLPAALGKRPSARSGYGHTRSEVLTPLAGVCPPAEGETVENFATRAQEAGLSEEKLIEL